MATTYDQFEPDNWISFGVVDRPKLPASVSFLAGALVDATLPMPLQFGVNYPARGEVPHFIGGSIPIFSDQLLAALRGAGVDNIQSFDVVLHSTVTGEDWSGFQAVNVVGIVRAANLAESRYDTIAPGEDGGLLPLLAFKTLVLDAKTFPLPHMFRLAESPDILLLNNRITDWLDDRAPEEGWQFDTTAIEHA